MLKLNPQAILHLSKLNRMVLRVKGVRHGIAEEKGILELLKYVHDNKDSVYQSIYADFLRALSDDERASLNQEMSLDKSLIAEPEASVPEQKSSEPKPDAPVEYKTVYYRGVKKQVPIDPTKG